MPAGAATITIYAWIYVVIGVVTSAGMLGFINYVLEIAPAGQRPTYIGLFNTISGVLVLLPTAGGFLLRVTSYDVLFALTAAVLVVASVLPGPSGQEDAGGRSGWPAGAAAQEDLTGAQGRP